MKVTQLGSGFLLVLQKGEPIVDSLTKFCKSRIVRGGWLSGLGAVTAAEIGYYELDKKAYRFVKFDHSLEIVSLTGNISSFGDEVVTHIHVVLSDAKMKAFGGHLKEATVGGTCELLLSTFDKPLLRHEDANTGLKLLT